MIFHGSLLEKLESLKAQNDWDELSSSKYTRYTESQNTLIMNKNEQERSSNEGKCIQFANGSIVHC